MAGPRRRPSGGTGTGLRAASGPWLGARAAIGRWIGARARRTLGGPGRLRPVLLLGGVLALNTADTGTIGAAAAQLEADLGISHAQLGLLATASSAVGAIAAIPMGVLADRVTRVRLLTATVATWAVAMLAGGLAPDYTWLLASRLLLGAAVAASGPVVVSLTGDLIPPTDRARVLGWILTGEIIGAGIGLFAGGEIAAALSWRYAFFLLAAASFGLAVVLWRGLPEPARGGADRLPTDTPAAPDAPPDQAQATVAGRGVRPARERVLDVDASELSLRRATVYLLRIPSNWRLIVASSMGYFFFAGLRTFGVVFAQQHFRVSQAALGAVVPILGIAALAGAVLGGRFTDRALRHGYTGARIVVPAAGYTAAALLFLPGMAFTSIAIGLPTITLGAAALAAANPPLDAARLDIVPGSLWGRAESLRSFLRLGAEALAPATFGLVADVLARPAAQTDRASGLRDTFLIMTIPLLANGLILLTARRSYPVDVATAAACAHRPDR